MIKPFKRNEVLINVASALRGRGSKEHASQRAEVNRQDVKAAHPRRKITSSTVEEVVKGVQSGMGDADLMRKFDLSASGLTEVLGRLVSEGLLRESDVEERSSLSPGTVALDVPPVPFTGADERKPVIKAKDAVAAIRAGMDDLSLMRTLGISAKGLQSLFDKLVHAGLLTNEEFQQRPQPSTHDSVIEDVSRLRKHYLAVSAPVYDPENPSSMGAIRDVTENGIGIIGIKANVGDVKSLMIPTQAISSGENIWFEAVCLWSGQDEHNGEPVTAFQITKISEGSLKALRELIDALCLGH
jgi:DNA-binding HxlR family transcriptional regulator